MTNELITLLANLALSLSFVIALIFGIVQINAAARDRREKLSLESLRNFQTREFAELIQYIINHDIPSSPKELNNLAVNEQVMILQFSQEMETLGILVIEKYIDIDLVDKILGSFVSTTWVKYKNLVMHIRQYDPYMNEYYQWLAETIEKRMKENPRKPFYELKIV